MPSFEVRQKEYAVNGQKHFYFMTLNANEVVASFYPDRHCLKSFAVHNVRKDKT